MLALRDLSKDGLIIRQNLGITSPQTTIQSSSDFQQFNLLRTNLGVTTPQTSQVITVQDTYPINFNAFKVRTNLRDGGSEGASAYYTNPSIPSFSLPTTNLWLAASINRVIVSGYSGPLFRARVINNSNNWTDVDFSSINGVLNMSAVPRNNLIIPLIIYDQAGNGRNLIWQNIYGSSATTVILNAIKYESATNDYQLIHKATAFVTSVNTSDSSNITVYLKGKGCFGRGFDGWGSGWGYILRNDDGISTAIINSAGYGANAGTTLNSVGWTTIGTETGMLTSAGNFTVACPNGTLRSSFVNWGINVNTATPEQSRTQFFKEVALYNANIGSTNRSLILTNSGY